MKHKIHNDHQIRLAIMLEPWGEQYDLEIDDVIELNYNSCEGCYVVYGINNILSLYPINGSDYPINVYINGIDRIGGFHIGMDTYIQYHINKSKTAQQGDAPECRT